MKKKKRFSHSCAVGKVFGEQKGSVKKSRLLYKNVDKKALAEIYNKYYKHQVAALYRAVQD